MFLTELPLKLIVDEKTYLYFGKLAQSALGETGHGSLFSLDIADDIAGVFFGSKNIIVLGMAPIICNIFFTAVLYPINAFIMKKRVFR